jgi:hypothetical protein
VRHHLPFRPTLSLLVGLLAFNLTACGDETAADDAVGPDLETGIAEDPEYGKAIFGPAVDADSKEDSFNGRQGLPTSVDRGSAAVWEVRNKWADTNTAEARKAGMAWPANSGLTWDEKYNRWVESMEKIDGHNYGETFQLTTPYGKSLPAPAIECAETALFLRAAFASWYGLPFFVEAADRDGRIYLGHFGFLRADGSRYSSTPAFKSSYRDYSDRADTWARDGWPSDPTLRKRKLGGSQDDFQPFLGDGARAGTYFDEMFLNKRTGYFMVYLLSYFGSINLASPANLYNLKPEFTRAGDVLVKRYGRTGIGHVYVVKHAERGEDFFEVELVSGSMPRRQPKWEDAGQSRYALTAHEGGGSEVADSATGETYADYGGGIKRWRTPVVQSGRWVNIVPVADQGTFVDASDKTAIGSRPDRFGEILGSLSPEQKRDTLLQTIEAQREHLRRLPASCSARQRREEAFDKLYDVMEAEFGQRRAEVDKAYRMLEDYALPEMVYERSKTCCWNSSTAAMFEIVMQKASEDTEDHSAGECREPTPFYARDGGFDHFKAYAQRIGRGGEWVAWSADETCPQANVTDDTEAEHDWTPWCEIGETILGGGSAPVGAGDDEHEPNNAAASAAVIAAGTYELTLCGGDEDWFRLSTRGGVKVTVEFSHARGDIDVQLSKGSTRVASSASTDDREVVEGTGAGDYTVRVYHYGQVEGCQPYTLRASL